MQINIDPTLFKLRLPEAANFGKYRQQELDSALLNTFSNAEGINALSKRFVMKRYLQLSDAELATNEKLKAEELGIDRNSPDLLQRLYAEGGGEEMGGAGGLGDLGTGGDFGMDMSTTDVDLDGELPDAEPAADGPDMSANDSPDVPDDK